MLALGTQAAPLRGRLAAAQQRPVASPSTALTALTPPLCAAGFATRRAVGSAGRTAAAAAAAALACAACRRVCGRWVRGIRAPGRCAWWNLRRRRFTFSRLRALAQLQQTEAQAPIGSAAASASEAARREVLVEQAGGLPSLRLGDGLSILPLGHNGHSRQELFEVAAVAVQGFFVACYDAAQRRAPDQEDLDALRWQVFEDLAQRYGPSRSRRGLLLVAREAGGIVVGCIGIEAMRFEELPLSPEAAGGWSSSSSSAAVSGDDVTAASCGRGPVGAGSGDSMGRRRPVAYMSNLAVLEAARGHGVGRRLIQEAELQAKELLRLPEVVLFVNADNTAARRLYENLGYTVILQDRWAVRSLPAGGGNVDKVRVLNYGYSRRLVPKTQSILPGIDAARDLPAVAPVAAAVAAGVVVEAAAALARAGAI